MPSRTSQSIAAGVAVIGHRRSSRIRAKHAALLLSCGFAGMFGVSVLLMAAAELVPNSPAKWISIV
jgi:hypothetical protein